MSLVPNQLVDKAKFILLRHKKTGTAQAMPVFLLHRRVAARVIANAGPFGFPAFLFGGLFKVAIRANLLHDAFLVENLLHALKGAVDSLAFFQTDLNHFFHLLSETGAEHSAVTRKK